MEVKIQGGLGNQLFGLFGAMWAGQTLVRKTVLDIKDIDKNHTSGKYDFRSFNINAPILVREPKPFEVKARRLSDFIFERGHNSIVDDSAINSRDLLYEKLEYEISQGTLPLKVRLQGFFQDFSYFDSLAPDYQQLELKNPSKNYLLASKKIKNIKPIVVHIRIGDYLNNKFGLLSENFFASSIETMKKSLGKREIWIFTNSPQLLTALYPSILQRNFRIFNPSGDPAEAMILMSEAEGIVCSNSTFSFWAAKLAKAKSKVVVPKIYSKDSEIQIRSLPKSWTQIENTWL